MKLGVNKCKKVTELNFQETVHFPIFEEKKESKGAKNEVVGLLQEIIHYWSPLLVLK